MSSTLMPSKGRLEASPLATAVASRLPWHFGPARLSLEIGDACLRAHLELRKTEPIMVELGREE